MITTRDSSNFGVHWEAVRWTAVSAEGCRRSMPLARANSEGSVTVVTAASIPPHSPRHGLARNDFGRATERDSELHTTPGWNAQPEGLDVATAAASRVWGDGLKSAVVRAWAEFVVEAHNADGSRRVVGGESAAFFISIRGWAERVRARVKDNGDGSYTVRYKPHISGQYTIAISLYGARVPGSPFACGVTTPTPCAAQCVVRGKALHQAIARDKHTFEVQFRDNQGLPCHAEELDVYVEVIDDSASIPERALDGRHGTVDCRSGNGRTAQDDAGAVASRPSTPLMTEGCDEATSVPRMRMAECVVTSQQPLVVRSGHELDSERVGQVRPGSRVYLLEVHEMSTREQGANKDVRACVAVDEVDADNEESIAATVTKWRELFPVRYSWLDDDLTRAGMAASRNASRSGSPRAGQLSSVPTPRKVPLGWVTMAKAGRELLTPRTKLGAGDRQNHIRAWMRRLAVDKTLDARVRGSAANAMDAASSKSAKRERAYASLRNAASTRHDQGLIFRNEMSSDPKGIGFAYGGVDPGRLTHGHVIETHKVHYSITGTGAYNLHVGLRQQAMALPGSPFKLVVIPGPAHAIATAFPKASLPLRGVVGFEPENGCKIILESVDKMGNRCFEGGATVNCTCESEHVTTHCVDQGDGTYALEWRSTTSGTYEVSVHIDGLAIDGAPASMTLVADRPELEKTEISGSGLSKVAAGKAANVSITLMDTHSNIAGRASSASFLFGMTLCSSGNKELKDRWKCDASDPYEGGWLNDDMFQMVFVAENTGTLDLHLWCCPDGDEKAAHLPLPGSPFRIECVAGKASASGSLIDGFHKVETIIDKYGKKGAGKVEQRPNLADDGTATVIAGDSIVLKPLIRDQYHNPASAEQGSLSVTLTAPDENTIDLVPTILARGGLTTCTLVRPCPLPHHALAPVSGLHPGCLCVCAHR